MNIIPLVIALVFAGCTQSSTFAHIIDEATCKQELEPLILDQNAKEIDHGISPGNEDFFITYQSSVGPVYTVHFPLLPVSQWPKDKDGKLVPVPFDAVSSLHVDKNKDGLVDDIWIILQPALECRGVIHLRWNSTVVGYVLVEGGKEHI